MDQSPTLRLSVTHLVEAWTLPTEVYINGQVRERCNQQFGSRSAFEDELGRRYVGNLDQQRLLDGESIDVWRS